MSRSLKPCIICEEPDAVVAQEEGLYCVLCYAYVVFFDSNRDRELI
jgi:hypothetical protein